MSTNLEEAVAAALKHASTHKDGMGALRKAAREAFTSIGEDPSQPAFVKAMMPHIELQLQALGDGVPNAFGEILCSDPVFIGIVAAHLRGSLA